jgi:hypothetical protein
VAISAHFASGRSGALVAEVAAKEGTQETAVTLCGLALGMLLAPLLNASARAQWASFALLTLVHVVANAAAVQCLALRTLSRTRALLLLEASAAPGSASASSSSGSSSLPTPITLRQREPLLPVQYARLLGIGAGGEGGRLRLGCSLDALREGALLGGGGGGGGAAWESLVRLGGSGSGSGSRASTLADALAGGSSSSGSGGSGSGSSGGGAHADFFLLAAVPGQAWVAFSAGVTPRTQLLGWLAAVAALGHASASAVENPGRVVGVLAQWEAAGWDLAQPALEEEGWRVELLAGAGSDESKES